MRETGQCGEAAWRYGIVENMFLTTVGNMLKYGLERLSRYCNGEMMPLVGYMELFTYTLVLVVIVTLVFKIKK